MDETQELLTEETKKTVYDELADLMIDAELKGLILEDDVQKSSQFIFENMEKIKTKKELMDFLSILGKRWDIYNQAFLRLKKEELITQVQGELHQLTSK